MLILGKVRLSKWGPAGVRNSKKHATLFVEEKGWGGGVRVRQAKQMSKIECQFDPLKSILKS